jgi:hypothetical protein
VIEERTQGAEQTRMGSHRVVRRFRSFLPSLKGEGGFTLVESMMAAVLLMMVGTSLSGLLASSVVTYSSAREKTLAQQFAMDKIEEIRRMPFSQVGLANGNPSCTSPCPLVSQKSIDVVGLHAKLKLQILYVDDQTPNSFRTYANYKKVVVTIVRNKDQKEIAKEVTFVSAAARNAATESSIKAGVIDFPAGAPVVGATVNLATGPSAPRTDLTNAGGEAIFPALTATPASGSQAFYDLNLQLPFGYSALKDDLPPSGVSHTALGVAQSWQTNLRVYKSCSVTVSVGSPPMNGSVQVPYTISIGSGRGAEAFARPAGSGFLGPISTLAGEGIVPGPLAVPNSTEYVAGVSAVVGSGSTAKYFFAPALSKPVPINYAANNLGQSYAFPSGTWGTWYNAGSSVSALTVKVQTSGGTAIAGARVAVSGGPVAAPGIYVAGVTNSSGLVTISIPSGPGYTINAWGPNTRATPLTGQNITSATTKTLTAS